LVSVFNREKGKEKPHKGDFIDKTPLRGAGG